jgi:ribulose-5-phosphate 4-epimerase/fuculose-1-phosphate aldolase
MMRVVGAFAALLAGLLLVPCDGCHRAGAQASAETLEGAIDSLVTANRIVADRGIIDAYGHVSIRHPSNHNRYLMARALAPALVTAADIMEFDLDSIPLDQRGRNLFIERFIHGEIYKLRADVNAVIHTHSPGVIPFGVTNVPLRPILHTASFLHVGVPIFEIRDAGGVTDMLVRSNALGKALATTLGDRPVALMRGHGNVVVGATVQQAVIRAVYTEDNARMLAAALSLGGPINYISPEEGALRDRTAGDLARAWELWKSRVVGK